MLKYLSEFFTLNISKIQFFDHCIRYCLNLEHFQLTMLHHKNRRQEAHIIQELIRCANHCSVRCKSVRKYVI